MTRPGAPLTIDRIEELTGLLDSQRYEIGPLDRDDLLNALFELIGLRRQLEVPPADTVPTLKAAS